MVNPHLGILGLNPRKKRKGSKLMARRNSKAHMDWVRSFKKNPRRRHHRRKRNPSVRHVARRTRHHARRAYSALGFTLPPMQSVLYVGVGMAGTPIVESFLSSYIPASITGSSIGKFAVRIGTVLGLSFAVKSLMGKEAGKMVGIGGGAYVALSAIKDFFPGVIPGLSAYPMGGPVSTRMLEAYAGPRALGAYNRGLAAPAFGALNTPNSQGRGGQNIVAARFRRFQ